MAAVASHQGLQDAIAKSRKTIEEWASNQKAAADRISSGAQAEFEAFQKSMDETRATILALQLESKLCLEGKDSSKAKLERELKEQKSTNAHLEAVLTEKKQVVASLLKQHEKVEKKAKKAKESTDSVALQNNMTVEDLTQGLVNYKHLGLDFQKAENESLRFSFTQIDEADPERKFTFVLAFTDDHWKVSECEHIDSAVVCSLVAELDENNDVGRFVRAMRKAFVASIE